MICSLLGVSGSGVREAGLPTELTIRGRGSLKNV